MPDKVTLEMLALVRAIVLWQHSTSASEKMRALFPGHRGETTSDRWYEEKKEMMGRPFTHWISQLDAANQRMALAAILERYGEEGTRWARGSAPQQYYCRFCGHQARSPEPPCGKCGSSVPLREE